MTGLWLVSYLVLWGLVVIMCFLLLSTLRQLGLVYRQLEAHPSQSQEENSVPALENDGPAIGTPIVDLEANTMNGFGTLTTLRDQSPTLLVLISPMCETCQHVVEPLNALVADDGRAIHPVVIMRADEQGCRAFLSVFPLHMPVICDRDQTITMGLRVHRTPFGLLYDEHGTLVRKGLIEGHDDLLALLGDEAAPITSQARVFPRFVPSLSA